MSAFVLITLSISFTCNLFAGLLSYLILYTDIFASRRIQGQRYRAGVFRSRLPLITFNLGLLMVLSYLGLSLFEESFSWELAPTSAGTVLMLLIQFAALVIVDDAYFYFFHRTLHERARLYQKVHKIHHHAFAPLPLEYIYVHPLEWMVGAGGIPVGLALIYSFQGEISVWAFWFFALWRNLHEIDIHSGLSSNWSLSIPFLGTTEHHDLHHMKNSKGNYSSTFTYLDRLMGTTLTPRSQRKSKGGTRDG